MTASSPSRWKPRCGWRRRRRHITWSRQCWGRFMTSPISRALWWTRAVLRFLKRCGPYRSHWRRFSKNGRGATKVDSSWLQAYMYAFSVYNMYGNLYTGWPRKNATLTINNFKKTRYRMKNLCAFLRIKFFFQQDDTKIVNFDEGVLILDPFFWGNVSFKICTFCIKSHVWGREEFLWV